MTGSMGVRAIAAGCRGVLKLGAAGLILGLHCASAVALERDIDPAYRLSAEAPGTAVERARLGGGEECSRHRAEFRGGPPDEQQRAQTREVLAYQGLVEEALAMRARSIRLLDELRDKIAHRQALSGRDLLRLNQGAVAMLEQRAALYRISLAHECWLDEPVPDDPQAARRQATGIAMSLSAALVLYDNYLSVISLYRSDPVLRQHLNRADSGFALPGGELNRIAASFASPENRSRVRRALMWLEEHAPAGALEEENGDEAFRYLAQLIDQSPSRNVVRHVRPLEFVGNMLGMFSTLGADAFAGLSKDGVHVSSLLFGNAVGLVESRRGKLDARPSVLAKVAATARAGDILLEKTPFRLTDAFIPGHWGHVAVWVGSEAELRELGVWDHPVVRPLQEKIRAGRGVVEALRSGVEMNTLAHFLNVDDLALLRQDELSHAQRAEIVLQALRQVGKGYDFNFDVESTNRIVCSELVYHSYLHLDWPTERRLGRVTISPDNVAVRAVGGGPLDVALLYRDGEEVESGRADAMARLVQAQVVRLARR
ncbi:YiiX/YebB-like N1pC/P60 family cysteine hydrolase [Aromatoleum evansii]|uniref:YiiX/YebB-like N1pC/P60 family cysteine hydrolase n=1 Tax=Aromatoleum evansii TaxID=59406 RepID=UPI00145EB4C7|nr:Poxvirus G6 [Aromatoleum evansii]